MVHVLEKPIGAKGVYKLKPAIEEYQFETLSFYGVTKTPSEKSVIRLAETALALKLAGSEICRHVNLNLDYVDHVWEVGQLARKMTAKQAVDDDYKLLRGYGLSPVCTH